MTIARELDIILAHGPELSAGGLDYYKLGLWAASQPNSRILSLDPALPPEELERRLRAFLHRDQPHTVLVAALDPRHRARHILRLLTETLKVNPELVSVVDLQEALGSPDPQACSLKAHHLIGLNASMITRAEPITTQEMPVTSRVLVWGDSFAALKAAVESGRSGLSGHSGASRRNAFALAPRGAAGPAPRGGAARSDQPGPVPPRHSAPAPDPPGGGAGQCRKFPGAAPDLLRRSGKKKWGP